MALASVSNGSWVSPVANSIMGILVSDTGMPRKKSERSCARFAHATLRGSALYSPCGVWLPAWRKGSRWQCNRSWVPPSGCTGPHPLAPCGTSHWRRERCAYWRSGSCRCTARPGPWHRHTGQDRTRVLSPHIRRKAGGWLSENECRISCRRPSRSARGCGGARPPVPRRYCSGAGCRSSGGKHRGRVGCTPLLDANAGQGEAVLRLSEAAASTQSGCARFGNTLAVASPPNFDVAIGQGNTLPLKWKLR